MLPSEVYKAAIKDADGNDTHHNVTIDEVHVLKKGKTQIFLGSKGGYFFMVKSESGGGVGGGAAELNAMAIGFYYAVVSWKNPRPSSALSAFPFAVDTH